MKKNILVLFETSGSPRWFDDKYLSKPKGVWKMSHRDSRALRKANKKFERTGKWT